LATGDPPPAIERGNLFAGVPSTLASERFDVLLRRPDLRLERIVSTGHVTPPGEWYDQADDEWVWTDPVAATLWLALHAPPAAPRIGAAAPG
jgi:hypothetical protein